MYLPLHIIHSSSKSSPYLSSKPHIQNHVLLEIKVLHLDVPALAEKSPYCLQPYSRLFLLTSRFLPSLLVQRSACWRSLYRLNCSSISIACCWVSEAPAKISLSAHPLPKHATAASAPLQPGGLAIWSIPVSDRNDLQTCPLRLYLLNVPALAWDICKYEDGILRHYGAIFLSCVIVQIASFWLWHEVLRGAWAIWRLLIWWLQEAGS